MLIKILKTLFLLIIISLSSCFPFNDGVCDKEISCNNDEDCAENHVCYTRYQHSMEGIRKYEPKEYDGDGCVTQVNSCIEDKCSNYNCGELGCKVIVIYDIPVKTSCDCGNDKYYNAYKNTCENSCNKNSDCEAGYSCNNINECTLSCTKDEDCKNDQFSDSESCDISNRVCVIREWYMQ